jgi:hypothetical protein
VGLERAVAWASGGEGLLCLKAASGGDPQRSSGGGGEQNGFHGSR